MFAFVAISNAQAVAMTGSDTVTNTASVSCSTRIVGSNASITIQAVLTKLSGTVDGYSILYGSLDGVTYTMIDTVMDATNVTTNSAFYVVANPKSYVWLKLTHTGVGTMSAILEPKILIQKQ